MKHAEAEKLLGGYATDTLTGPERRILLEAALHHQDLFEALVDEEALRELLADPAAKAQLLEALSSSAPPKVIPFYRSPGLIGAAASLLVASIAGLAYLRSPDAMPPVARQEAVKAPATQAIAVPPAAQAPAAPTRKATPATPPKGDAAPLRILETPAPARPSPPAPAPAAGATESVRADAVRDRNQVEYHRMEAQDSLAKKAEAPRPATTAVMEVIGAVVPPSGEPKAKAAGGVGMSAVAAPFVPAWTLDLQPDGSTRVVVTAPRGPQILLLRRGASGVEVLKLQPIEDRRSALVQWRGQVRLAVGDALDLYLLTGSVADPAKLPEMGPVDGFRARIHPAAKKDAPH